MIEDHEECSFLILSLSSPSVESQIKLFIDELSVQFAKLGSNLPEFIIVGGDTNTAFSSLDKEGGSLAPKHKAIHCFDFSP